MTESERHADEFRVAVEWVLDRPCSQTELRLMAHEIQTTIDLMIDKLDAMGLKVWNDGEKTWFLEDGNTSLESSSIFPLICDYIQAKKGVPV